MNKIKGNYENKKYLKKIKMPIVIGVSIFSMFLCKDRINKLIWGEKNPPFKTGEKIKNNNASDYFVSGDKNHNLKDRNVFSRLYFKNKISEKNMEKDEVVIVPDIDKISDQVINCLNMGENLKEGEISIPTNCDIADDVGDSVNMRKSSSTLVLCKLETDKNADGINDYSVKNLNADVISEPFSSDNINCNSIKQNVDRLLETIKWMKDELIPAINKSDKIKIKNNFQCEKLVIVGMNNDYQTNLILAGYEVVRFDGYGVKYTFSGSADEIVKQIEGMYDKTFIDMVEGNNEFITEGERAINKIKNAGFLTDADIEYPESGEVLVILHAKDLKDPNRVWKFSITIGEIQVDNDNNDLYYPSLLSFDQLLRFFGLEEEK